jgi:hypothetical protein
MQGKQKRDQIGAVIYVQMAKQDSVDSVEIVWAQRAANRANQGSRSRI